jgi:N-methylhydantoinase A
MTRRIRIGIDTGGTFTDVVAFDEDTGELVTTKTPSTPSNPADGFLAGIDKVLGLLGGTGADVDAVSHGTTVATNQLLEGKVDRIGFITTEGYEAMLEIARQSVPDGYGNSYFWVKPDRIVPRDLVKGVGGRLDFTGAEVRPFDENGARAVARGVKAQGSCSRAPKLSSAIRLPSRTIRPLPISSGAPRAGSSMPTPSPRG